MNVNIRGMAVRMVWWLVGIVAVGFVVGSLLLYFLQSRFIFYPMRQVEATPADIGVPYEDVYIEVEDGERVNAWYTPPDAADANGAVVLVCHGNAGNISHRLATLEFFRGLGAGVLLFDYRGYGRSDGTPGEEEVYADARASYNWLVTQKKVAAERIVFYGESLGGAIAADLASKRPCRGLMVESSFTSIVDMGKRMFPILPVRLLVRHEFNSMEKMAKVRCPVLVTHSPDDEVIPYAMGERLYAAANEPKRFVALVGDHNGREYFGLDSYRTAVQEILTGAAWWW